MAKSKARFLSELLGDSGLVKKSKSALAGADEVLDLDTIPTIPNSKLQNSSISIAGHSTALGGSVSLNTGNISEHTDYKYYTDVRARKSVSATGSLSYNSTTGVISFTERTDAEVRGLVSAGGSLSYNSSTGVFSYTTPTTIASLSNHDTADLAEGTNLYFTNARADARIAAASTSDLSEGTNLYFTNARADARIAAATTDDLSEGSSNLYYTDARADARVALIVDSAPGTLNTLNELAAALGDDANFSTTVTNSIATKMPLAGGTFTGNVNITKETPYLNLTDSSASRTLGIFVDDNNSVLRSSGPLLLQINAQSALTIDASRNATFAGTVTGGNGTFTNLNAQLSGNGGLPVSSGTAQTYGSLRVEATSFATILDMGTAGATGAWLQASDKTALGTNYSLLLNPNGGNVGIGTSSIESTLHLQAASAGGRGATLTIDNNATSTVGNESQITFLTDAGASVAGTANARIKAINTNAGDGRADLTFTTWNGSFEGERMRIGSSGNVSIGVFTGTEPTWFGGSDLILNDNTFAFQGKNYDESVFNTSVDAPYTYLTHNGYWNSGWQQHKDGVAVAQLVIGSGSLQFKNAPDAGGTDVPATGLEAKFTVDASGNLLVGTTNANPTSAGVNDAGVELSNTGGVRSTVAANAAATFNRKGSAGTENGEVVLIRSNGTTVGSIGTNGGGIYLGSPSGAGKYFANNGNFSPSTDGSKNLGDSSLRWQDLYLSGGAYLGGVAAANKLDDYEEGTWTAGINYGSAGGTAATLSESGGSYVKIGRMVTVHFEADVSNTNSGSGDVYITGLPFTIDDIISPTGLEASGNVAYFTGFSSGVNSLALGADTAGGLALYGQTSSTQTAISSITAAIMGTGEIRGSITYFTT